DVVLDAGATNIGADLPRTLDTTRRPIQTNRDLTKVAAVTGANIGVVHQGDGPEVKHTAVGRNGRRVVGNNELRGKEISVELVPVVEPEGFRLFHQNLRRPQ